MAIRQRLFTQKQQVDTQWEMIGSPSALPSSEVVAEYDTVDNMAAASQNAGLGKPSNEAFEGATSSGQPAGMLWDQTNQLETSEQSSGIRVDSAIPAAYDNLAVTNLTAAVNNAVTALPVYSAQYFPVSGSYGILVDQEQMTVTGGQGTTSWTVTRGVNGTTAAAHASNAVVSKT